MDFTLFAILEACILGASASIDAFLASFAYGTNKIKIPMLSVQIINITSSSILGLSFLVGTVIKNYIPHWVAITICFTILFIMGMIKLFDSIIKSIIRKNRGLNKEIKFSIFNLKCMINLYASPEKADIDNSKTISPSEAFLLALALSLDGIAIGFGAALGNVNGLLVFLWTLITDAIAVMLGCYIGNKIAHKLPFNISWVSGVVLIILAIMKLF